MDNVPITRAAHVIGFCEEFRRIGVPVDRHLEKNLLPVFLEETPDAYINNLFATTFVGLTASKEGIEDAGWLGATAFRESQLNSTLVASMAHAPTVLSRLRHFFTMSRIEDTHLRLEMNVVGNCVQVISDMDIPEDTPGMDASNWTQIAVIVEVIRSIAGPNWKPSAIYFKTDFRICDDARTAYGNTRITVGAPHTEIWFPRNVLSLRTDATAIPTPSSSDAGVEGDDLGFLRSLLRPYLKEKTICIRDAAQISGTSARTLQRRLRKLGTTYSELVESTRFEMAADLLSQTDAKIIDIAAEVGLGDQANFGRLVRKFAGTSPKKYRQKHREFA